MEEEWVDEERVDGNRRHRGRRGGRGNCDQYVKLGENINKKKECASLFNEKGVLHFYAHKLFK